MIPIGKKKLLQISPLLLGILVILLLPFSIFAADSDEKTTVSLYRRLASNPPVLAESFEVTGNEYTFEKTKLQLIQEWHLSSTQYVFIGWFYMGEDGLPDKWTGDQTVKLKPGEDNAFIAVFNAMPNMETNTPAITTYSLLDGKEPSIRERMANTGTYSLPDEASLFSEWKIDSAKYAFAGWYYANGVGKPVEEHKEPIVRSEPGNTIRVVAVFTSRENPQPVKLYVEPTPSPTPASPTPTPESASSPFRPANSLPRIAVIIGGICLILLVLIITVVHLARRRN